MTNPAAIDPVLADVATILRCLGCGRSAFTATAAALTCGGCGAVIAVHDGIPHVRAADEDPAITRERAAVNEIEAAPLPTDFSLASLLADRGPLADAFASLPYDDGSVYFRENKYFQDVARFAAVFDYVAGQLGPAAGRLLDVGADLTWSTSRLAARGWRAVGIDINHHLAASQVLRRRGPAFAVVNMDMHLPAFREGTFDAITAFNALHHTHRLEALIGTLTTALGPGGRLCVVEPYWFLKEVRQAFGAAEIEAGINENVYRLEEWHRTFVQAGLELVTHTIGHAFNAIYRKRTDGVTRTISLGDAEAELFAGFYRGSVTGLPVLPGLVAPGATVEIPVRVVNESPLGWSSDGQLPVRVGYRIHARTGEERVAVSLENPRASLGELLSPAGTRDVRVAVALPELPGEYEIEFDLVQEFRAWFSGQGVPSWTTRVRVGNLL